MHRLSEVFGISISRKDDSTYFSPKMQTNEPIQPANEPKTQLIVSQQLNRMDHVIAARREDYKSNVRRDENTRREKVAEKQLVTSNKTVKQANDPKPLKLHQNNLLKY